MRQLYVSVRLAALLVAVGAGAGCVAVGDDAQEPAPRKSSRPAAEQDDKGAGVGPDGGPVVNGDSPHGAERKGAKRRPGDKAQQDDGSASPSASRKPSRTPDPSAPTRPTPPRTPPPSGPSVTPTTPSTPAPSTPGTTPTPQPPSAEPSSSAAHRTQSTFEGGGEVEDVRFRGREPSPQAGPS